MKIKCGSYEVLASGTINSVKDEPVIFVIPGTPELTVRVAVDRSTDESEIHWDSVPEKYEGVLTFRGKNHQNYGLSEPFKIGTHNERDLSISFRVTTYESPDSYSLIYTFYLGEKA